MTRDRFRDVSRGTLRSGNQRSAYAPFSRSQLEKLREIAGATGAAVPPGFLPACESFLAELAKWNRRMNLISRKDAERVVERHILDSLCLLAYSPHLSGKRILDVGSGAGFPGIVLGMWESEASITLIESRSKPVAFLRSVKRCVGLENVQVVHARIESAANPQHLPLSDIVTSRAVGGTLGLAERVAAVLKPGGAIVVYAARCGRGGLFTAADSRALERLGYDRELITPTWQSLTTLLILRKLS